ncbi:hypothetical protein N0824_03510 [Microcystis sp. 0824]|nr:hypothetical protein N0824_03510 [Microcystis sp. 0824]
MLGFRFLLEMGFLLGITITFRFGSTDSHYFKKLLNWKNQKDNFKKLS